MSNSDDTIGMPRVALAIRLVLFALFVGGLAVIFLVDGDRQPWLFGTGVVLTILFGVASVLFHVIGWVHGSYVDGMEIKDFHHSGTSRRNSLDDYTSGGGNSFGD